MSRVRILAVVCLIAASFAAGSAGAAADSLTPADTGTCCTVSDQYVQAVDGALGQGRDVWGEQVMRSATGPTYDNVKDFLVPLNGGGVAPDSTGGGVKGISDTGSYYLPFTMPDGDTADSQASTDPNRQHYAFPLADGGGIMADYHVPCAGEAGNQLPDFLVRCPNFYESQFFVGHGGSERYGSALQRLAEPTLYRGYLPVLGVRYTDALGVRYSEETFAARVPGTGSLVSFVRLNARVPLQGADDAQLRVHIRDPRNPALSLNGNAVVSGSKTYLAFSGQPTLAGADLSYRLKPGSDSTIYLVMVNNPTAVADPQALTTAGRYLNARASVASYWDGKLATGATISVPEPYVQNAMRNVLIQNLIMGWRTSVGNGYEDGYVPEDTDAVDSLGDFGFGRDYAANLQVLLDATRGTDRYPGWANGTKLESIAHYVESTGETALATRNLGLIRTILDTFQQQIAADPHRLLPPQACCEDNAENAYWFHGEAVAWRGMVDILPVLDRLGEHSLATAFRPAVEAFGTSLRAAISTSSVTLPDGSLFIPQKLFSGQQPYQRITATREGSYWNLLAPYGFATGILSQAEERGVLQYLFTHGGTLLGQTRFNWQGEPVGQCDPANLPGYYGEGTDELYGYQYANFLSNTGEADRLRLTFYGKLAHSMTRGTFISGEGNDVEPCPWQYYRQSWWSPMSTSGSVYLNALRQLLVHESIDGNGLPTTLALASATPRGWLADGRTIRVSDLPTRLGKVSFTLQSRIGHGEIDATLDLPRTGQKTTLGVNLPAGYSVTAVQSQGRAVAYVASTHTVDLTGLSGHQELTITVRR